MIYTCPLSAIFSFTYFIFIGSNVENDDEFISSDGWTTRELISVLFVLSCRKSDGIVTINSAERSDDIEPTMIKGRKKPPILYNQAPIAGPEAKENTIY